MMKINNYKLDGGSSVIVYKVFDDKRYFAIVGSTGRYPRESFVARNSNRTEFLLILEGSIKICHNGKFLTLNKQDHIMIQNGDTYYLDGIAKIMVFVEDQENATTEIINQKTL